jgi:hypothetical protein
MVNRQASGLVHPVTEPRQACSHSCTFLAFRDTAVSDAIAPVESRYPYIDPHPSKGSHLTPPHDFARDFAHRGQKTPYFTLLHPTLCIWDLYDKSSIYSDLRMHWFGLKIPRPQGHGGSTPPFGTI